MAVNRSKKIAIFSGQVFWYDGQYYSTDEAFVRFVTGFTPHFEKIVFCDAVTQENRTQPYALNPKTTEVCALPYFNVYSFWRNLLVVFPRIYRIVSKNIKHWDLVWLHGPHPVALIFAYICRRQNKPFFLFIRQNIRACVGYRNRGPGRALAIAAASLLEYIFYRLSKHTPTFVVGKELFDSYKVHSKRIFQAAVSLVSSEDITAASTRSFNNSSQVRLLSVGRLAPEKGLTHLIKAVAELIFDRKKDVVLSIVGDGSEEKRLRKEAARRGLAEKVRFLGYMTYNDELLKLYRESDIFVLPSLTEGSPQTLFEAMACGIPVIATRVGGVPHVIKDNENGILIDPASPGALCDAIDRLSENHGLRKRLATRALEGMRSHTMEAERERIVGKIEKYFRVGGEGTVLL